VQRKLIDTERRTQFASMDYSKISNEKRWVQEYIYRDASRYWHIPDFDCSELWKRISLSPLFGVLFEKILPATNILINLETIQTPILLTAGVNDFDCCPWRWKELPNLPAHFTYHEFKASGHWPHYEESSLFNDVVKEWSNKLKI
jgi:pimeloyl-ACP methyl ester carboxylesterase